MDGLDKSGEGDGENEKAKGGESSAECSEEREPRHSSHGPRRTAMEPGKKKKGNGCVYSLPDALID